MRIQRRFIWGDDRADDYQELLTPSIDHHLIHDGVPFRLRHWDMRYVAGKPRITEAVYDEAVEGKVRAQTEHASVV